MTGEPGQLLLPLDHPPHMEAADFYVSHSNQEAWSYLQGVSQWGATWPTSGVMIYGPSGCGKTHLARIFARQQRALLLTCDSLMAHTPLDLVSHTTHFVLDDVDRWVTQSPEVALRVLQLYNVCQEHGTQGSLVFFARTPPARWGAVLPDLISRLNTLPMIPIAAPDDGLIRKVMAKLFQDFQVEVSEAVLVYLGHHMERSFAQAQHLVTQLNALSLKDKKSVTLDLCRRVLAASSDSCGEGRGERV